MWAVSCHYNAATQVLLIRVRTGPSRACISRRDRKGISLPYHYHIQKNWNWYEQGYWLNRLDPVHNGLTRLIMNGNQRDWQSRLTIDNFHIRSFKNVNLYSFIYFVSRKYNFTVSCCVNLFGIYLLKMFSTPDDNLILTY